MSLVRVSARLPLRSCLQIANSACRRLVKKQDNFEAVFSAFLWDEKTGFGETVDGNTVLVSKEYKTGGDLLKKTEGQFWQEIIDPTSYIDHEALKDELQMTVLSYDDDVVRQDRDDQVLPIYKGHIDMTASDNNCPPGGKTAGFNGGSRTALA